jgi:hypothetical protein
VRSLHIGVINMLYAFLAAICAFLAARRLYRKAVPEPHYLFEQGIRERHYPLVRGRVVYVLRGEKVPWYEMLFVWLDIASFQERGELESTVIYYKDGELAEGKEFEEKRHHFDEAFLLALKRRQGRAEFVTHLRSIAPYDYYEKVYTRKAPRRDLEVSF